MADGCLFNSFLCFFLYRIEDHFIKLIERGKEYASVLILSNKS